MPCFKALSVWSVVLLAEFLSVHGDMQKAVTAVQAVRNTAEALRVLRESTAPPSAFASFGLCPSGRYDDLPLSQPCKNQVQRLQLLLTDTNALAMCDASTKVPEGIMAGNMEHLGNFEECIAVRDVNITDGIFHGKHCLGTITFNLSAPQQPGDGIFGMVVMMTIMPFKVARCLPSTCNLNDTRLIMERDNKLILSYLSFMHPSLEVLEMECHTADKPDFSTEDWVAMAVLIFFAVLVVLSTCYDILTKDGSSRSNLLLAFSVYTNGKKLLATSNSADTLHCVHGIRFISMAWVVIGHRYMNGMFTPALNLLTYMRDFIPDWRYLFVTNGHLSVDTFFFLSGLLAGYIFFRQAPKMKFFNIPLYYLHRYLRLTPALAIMIMLQVSLWKYTSSGPIWDSQYSTEKSACEEKWWINLLYLQNYLKQTEQCLGQSWFLAVDMQLHWLSPLVLIPLWKKPKLGWILMGALMVGGLVTNFVISYDHKFSGSYIGAMQNPDDPMAFMKLLYWPVWARFMAYLVGIALGYLLVHIKTTGREIKLSKAVTLLLWLVAAFLMLFTLCIVQIFQQDDYETEPITASLYNSFNRPLWALGVALVVFLCATGHGGFANTFLSWDWFQVLGRLSYSVYLVHQSLQLSQIGFARSSVYLDDMYVIPHFFGDMVLSLILAIPLALVFESPFIVLEKELLGGKKPAPKPAPIASISNPHQTSSDEASNTTPDAGTPENNTPAGDV